MAIVSKFIGNCSVLYGHGKSIQNIMRRPNCSCPYLPLKETPFKAPNSSSSSENASSKVSTIKSSNKYHLLIVIFYLFTEDLLTITHTLFSYNPEAKGFVTKKIN